MSPCNLDPYKDFEKDDVKNTKIVHKLDLLDGGVKVVL